MCNCMCAVYMPNFQHNLSILTSALLGGGYFLPPLVFFAIAHKRMGISSPNFQELLVHQFYAFWPKKNIVAIIGQPEMT